MSTKIQEEYDLSRKYELSEIIVGEEKLVELTQKNVAKVEAMVRTDSNYRIDLDEKKSPCWITRMGKFLKGESCDHEFEEIIGKIVELLDKENSTHLNADGCGREEIKRRILIREKKILESLENRERGFELIDHLSEPTHPEESGRRSRRNISFASKFCHFSCFYIFGGEDAQDNFSIYDGVVARALPAYLDYYKEKLLDKKRDLKTIKKKIKDKSYKEYSDAIDDIIEASGSKISRNGFDHLIWYYFKGK